MGFPSRRCLATSHSLGTMRPWTYDREYRVPHFGTSGTIKEDRAPVIDVCLIHEPVGNRALTKACAVLIMQMVYDCVRQDHAYHC